MANIEHRYEIPVPYEVGEALDLTVLSKGDLEALVEQATIILKDIEKAEKAKAARERRERESKAAAAIRALAKEHGLDVTISKRRRRRKRKKSSVEH